MTKDWGRADWAVAHLSEVAVWYALRCFDAYGGRAAIAPEVRRALAGHGLITGEGALTEEGATALTALGGPFPKAFQPR